MSFSPSFTLTSHIGRHFTANEHVPIVIRTFLSDIPLHRLRYPSVFTTSTYRDVAVSRLRTRLRPLATSRSTLPNSAVMQAIELRFSAHVVATFQTMQKLPDVSYTL